MYVSYHQDDWNTWLPLAELAYNNSDHFLTKQSPFFTVYGRNPKFDSVHITQYTPAGKLSTKIQSLQKDVKRELEVSINRFKMYADKSRASPPVFNPGDMKISTHAYRLKLPSIQASTFPTLNQSRHQQSQIGIKSLLLQSSWKKKSNGKSLKYWIQSSIEESYGIWWNGKASVKTQRDPLGNQPKTSRIALKLSRITILYILKSQAPVLQELDFYGSWWGEELPKVSPTPGMHL
ncbi:hypothetical protein O181_011430 [Austropuccinia psidii MF-1]|uniref:Uncharacterized protein n=1 Tax=Austropuccinia psidii MF-1 TaxID=1389203 RepID=A0A9Q3GLW7_9BASI|nr:hypothetical protein [Austropuccinia psidii MF-1]